MRCLHRFAPAAIVVATAITSGPAFAQQPSVHVIRGVVTAANGITIGGVNVFLLEASDVATSDSAGTFTIRTSARASVTIVARRIGFTPAAAVVPVDTTGIVSI